MIHSKTTHTGLNSSTEAETSTQDEALAAPRPSHNNAGSSGWLPSTLPRLICVFPHALRASWLNVTFVSIPAGILVSYQVDNPLLAFICNAVAMIPSSRLLLVALEDFNFHLNGVAGRFATVMLRNPGLLVISLILILSHQVRILASLLYGSLPVNLLLEPGLQFIIGGMRWHLQDFAIGPVQTMSSCVFLGVFGLSMVTLAGIFRDMRSENQVVVLHGVSFTSLACHVTYLFFRLVTHSDLFADSNLRPRLSPADDEGDERNMMDFPSMTSASGGVIVCTVMLAISAKLATDQIPACVQAYHLSDFSIGLVVLPVAISNPLSLLTTRQASVDVYLLGALDRTIQLVLMYTPIFWLFARTYNEHLSSQVEAFATIALFLSAFVSARVLSKGTAHWFTGLVMVVIYIAISIGAFPV